MQTPTLDHVAIHVHDRDATADQLVRELDWHVIERTDRFTLLGAHPDHGKLTLLDATDEQQPDPGRLLSIMLAERGEDMPPPITISDGLIATFAPVDTLGPSWQQVPRHALVGVSLKANDPPIAAAVLEAEHGMHVDAVSPEHAVLDVDGTATSGRIILNRERWSSDADGMLDHVGIRVEDAEAWRERAERDGIEVVKWVEAEHSRAVFLAGPDGLVLEFVELTKAFDEE